MSAHKEKRDGSARGMGQPVHINIPVNLKNVGGRVSPGDGSARAF